MQTTRDQAMATLEKMGTAQNRKVYSRHGVTEEMFGVSYANLGKLRKRFGRDQELARELWTSGNHDARVLATLVAEPDRMSSSELDAWSRELQDHIVTDAFAKLAAETAPAAAKARRWTRSADEWIGRAGWVVLARLVAKDDLLPEPMLERHLSTIESRIHRSKNRVRDAMVSALIAIGLRSPRLLQKAMAASRRIGNVDVDHGETGCKTPDAVACFEAATGRTRVNRGRRSRRARK